MRAFALQELDDLDGGGFAEIVGVRLEGQTEHRDFAALEVVAEFRVHLLRWASTRWS
jgi:hypothetical protein